MNKVVNIAQAIKPSTLSFRGIPIHKMSKKQLIELVTELYSGVQQANALNQAAIEQINKYREQPKLIVPDYVQSIDETQHD